MKLNFNFEKAYLKDLFRDFDKDKSGTIDFKEFQVMLDFLRNHKEVSKIFYKYANPKTKLMHAEEILKFCHTEQGEKDFTL